MSAVSRAVPIVHGRLALAAGLLWILSAAPGAQSRPPGRPVISGGVFEASGVAAVPGTNGALVVDDGLTRELLWVTFDESGTAARARRIPAGVSVVDKEDITTDGAFFYAIGSQSKATGRNAVGLVRFRFDPTRAAVSGVETVTGLRALITTAVPELGRLARGRSGPLDIEGLTWDAARARLIFGLRTPQDQQRAVLVFARLRNPALPLSNDNLQFDPTPVRLDLGGLTVRGLGYDAASRRVLIVGGAAADGGSVARLYEWDGEAASSARQVRVLAADAKPEGVTTIVLGGRARTLIVYDAGRFELLD